MTRLFTILTGIAIALALFFLTGCYETSVEVIPAHRAEPVPNLVGTTRNVTFSAIPGTNDYIRKVTEKNKTRSRRFRAMHLRDDVWIVQVFMEEINSYTLNFVAWDPQNRFIKWLEPDVSFKDLVRLARAYNIVVEDYDIDDARYITGQPRDILRFLIAHRNFRFFEFTD